MLPSSIDSPPEEFQLRSLVEEWTGRIERARLHKKPWQDIADECDLFYSAATGFLWDQDNKQKVWGKQAAPINPTFQITIARAFELVALFGPTLYWANPTRTAKQRDLMQVPRELFGNLELPPEAEQAMQQGMQQGMPVDPQVQQVLQARQAFEQEQQQYQQESLSRSIAAQLQARVLNHTPDLLELNDHSDRAITDLLIKGRGVLVTEPYRHPGSGKLLVGSFYETPDRVFIDPDCEAARDAWWVAVEKREPYWKVEEKFQLQHQPGILKKWATQESGAAQGSLWSRSAVDSNNLRATGQAKDMVRYYEIYSRCGVGVRGIDIPTPVQQALESVSGNFCYMAVAPGVPFLLNCPDWVLRKGTVEEVRSRMQWPIPFWTEGKFPVNLLDVYQRTRYPWPLPPIAPGLGELKAINVILCSLIHHIWMAGRTIVGVPKTVEDAVTKILEKRDDFAVLGLDDLEENVNNVIQFLNHPSVNRDVWEILSALMEMFDRRVGLSDLLYGVQATQSRSATDIKTRQSNLSIRPQDMARRVAAWQTQVARREAYGLWYKCEGKDLDDILGEAGGRLWDQFVRQMPGERVVRQIDYRIEAASMGRPDRDQDIDAFRDFAQNFMSLHQEYMGQTGNPAHVNALQEMWGEINHKKMDDLLFEPPQPPDPSQDPAMQQAQAELEQQQQEHQLEMQQKGEEHGQDMTQDQQRHEQEMRQKGEEGMMKMREGKIGLDIKLAQMQMAAQKPQAASNGKK